MYNEAWKSEATEEEHPPLGPAGWCRVLLRGLPLGLLTFGCLAVLLLLRLVERPIFGLKRPWTPRITQLVCRSAFAILGMRFETHGTPILDHGAVVANHASWLDIFALNARQRVYFVAKSEVASWPGIGWLGRGTGTVFIERKRSRAAAQKSVFEARLNAGHQLLFFPEGTSTDGLRVLPFKPTLFAAFFTPRLQQMQIQPVSVRYTAPDGASPRFYGWWGDMDFASHLLKTLGAVRHGGVEVIYHTPLTVGNYPDRKALAAALEAQVRGGMGFADN